jgi:hypothetical protein
MRNSSVSTWTAGRSGSNLSAEKAVNSWAASADGLWVADRSAEPVPPGPPEVVARSLCLASLLARGHLESAIPLSPDPADAAAYMELARRLNRWLNEQDFTAHFTTDELLLLSTSPGSWSPEQHRAHASRVEALGVLLWAVGRFNRLPSYEEPFPEPDLEPLVGWCRQGFACPTHPKLAGFPRHGGSWLTEVAQMRSYELIRSLRSTAECWHWRGEVAALQRAHTPPPAGQDYAVMVAVAAEEAHSAGAIPRPVEEDFPLFGRPFGRAERAVQERIATLAQARRLALNWLSGFATPWDQVPLACSQAA